MPIIIPEKSVAKRTREVFTGGVDHIKKLKEIAPLF
jgi:hypothetical protein